jgi:hypothetical protein
MKITWFKAWTLFREHWIYFCIPYACAELVNIGRGQLNHVLARVIFRLLATRHSVLGGSELSSDLGAVQRQAIIIITPVSLVTQYLTACSYVVAFLVIAKLVETILKEEKPNLFLSLAQIGRVWRKAALFSLQYGVLIAILSWVGITALSALQNSIKVSWPRFFDVMTLVLSVVEVGFVAWLLIPSAFNLVREEKTGAIARNIRNQGTAFAIFGSAVSLLLSEAVLKAESGFTIPSKGEWLALYCVNTIAVNLPDVLALLILALLAMESADDLVVQEHSDEAILPLDTTSE